MALEWYVIAGALMAVRKFVSSVVPPMRPPFFVM
jgi:hypothetical protein